MNDNTSANAGQAWLGSGVHMLVTSVSCSGDSGTDTLPPHSQMLSRTVVSPGLSWRSPPASSWERAAQCPEISVPAQLTLPWHLTVHTHFLAFVGSGMPPFSCHTWAQQKGLALLRAGPPPKGTVLGTHQAEQPLA